MKKVLLIGLIVFILLGGGTIGHAMDDGYGVYSKDQVIKIISEFLNQPKAQDVFRCPVSKISDQGECFSCHTKPSFKVKEALPDTTYDYPNTDTSIRVIDGKEIGFLYVNAISGETVKESFQYFEDRGINHIVMEIHSSGGSLFEGWRICGLMGEAEAEGKIIETRVYGFAASAAFLLAVSGTKGHRFANTHAELMAHELWSFKMFDLATPSSKEEEARVLRHLQDTGNGWLASRSNLSKEEIDSRTKNREFWMTGEDAKKHGFIDHFLNSLKEK